jgi:TolB-like protein
MSGDPEQEFFSDGISEELLNVLAKVKGLRVTSRTSAFAFKGKDISIPEIAEKLGVKHVLEGSVRMAGNRVRITTQLIEVETDSHLWSESYDRELADIFAVQDEIAAKVGEALKVALLGADSKPIRTSRETSIEIYSDYLLARQKLANFTVAAGDEAERLLKSVIERDPEYAPAYAALATTYWYMGRLWGLSASEVSERMTPLIEQALSLDRDLAEAWESLASVRWAQGDLEGAQAARDRAFELDPQHPQVLTGQILRWFYSHEPERGRVFAEELLRVDPLSPLNLMLMSWVYSRLGLWDDADRMMERIRSIDPHNIYYLFIAAWMADVRGDKVTAIELAEKCLALYPEATETSGYISQLYFDLGDMEAADFWEKESFKLVPEEPDGMLAAAFLHLYHNEEASALAIARKITQQDTSMGLGFEAGLRVVAASDLAAGNYDDVINRNLAYIPELMAGRFPVWKAAAENKPLKGIFWVALDLASAYLQAGADDKANVLLSLVESEFSHRDGWEYGFADVELYALRGEKEKALAALRVHAERGIGQRWRWHILYNGNLESIRDTPEFAAIVAEIEADMAEQLARVREMRRSGELTAIPELAVE